MKKFFDGVYSKAYRAYRFMPLIIAGVVLLLFLVWGIIDASAGITDFDDIIDDGEFFAVILWFLIGTVVAFISFVISVIAISPTVVRTDAALEIAAAMKNDTVDSASVVDTSELPEL